MRIDVLRLDHTTEAHLILPCTAGHAAVAVQMPMPDSAAPRLSPRAVSITRLVLVL
jgi:hypothetical protein